MQMSDSLAEKILKDAGVDNSSILELKANVKATHLPLATLILHHNLMSEEALSRAYSKELGIPFVQLSADALNHSHIRLLPEHLSRRHRVVVFDVTPDKTKLVASDTQLAPTTQEMLKKVLGPNFSLHIAPPSHLHSALDIYRQVNFSEPRVIKTPAKEHEQSTVLETIHHIIENAINLHASSIHIEPLSNLLVVRFRIDGNLKETYKLPLSTSVAINTRLKAMAGIGDIGAVEGRFRIEHHHQIYRIELFSLPVVDGEKITLNLFNESQNAPQLTDLGLFGKNLEEIENASLNRHGLILISGPKNSGVNTTLYSILESMKISKLNVLTIEDRLSFRLNGATQVELNSNIPNYETALELADKQELDVLLINKITGPITALRLVEASRHNLVLAGINASSSLSSLSLLSHFGVEPFQVAHASQLCISTRLVRKLCDNCKQPIHPTNIVLKNLLINFRINRYGGVKAVHYIEKQAAAEDLGMLKKTDLSSTTSGIKRLFEASYDGCINCNYTGFKGRIGLQEVLPLNDAIRSKIAARADKDDIEKLAIQSGFISLSIDGLIKALRGLTTIEEVLTCL